MWKYLITPFIHLFLPAIPPVMTGAKSTEYAFALLAVPLALSLFMLMVTLLAPVIVIPASFLCVALAIIWIPASVKWKIFTVIVDPEPTNLRALQKLQDANDTANREITLLKEERKTFALQAELDRVRASEEKVRINSSF